jgi:DNA (cytosine-5)-methyltransferase 1
MWFIKTKRAQTNTDYESWEEGKVYPTLNAFDVGESRTVAMVVYPYKFIDKKGNDMPLLMRMREGKPGGGKGPLISDNKSLTIATANDQTLYDDRKVRRLTPVEYERLQGFPDNWTDEQADTNRYKQVGNAVAVPVVDWIVKRLLDYHGQ